MCMLGVFRDGMVEQLLCCVLPCCYCWYYENHMLYDPCGSESLLTVH